jgi:signal transduction histidine kinase
VTDRGAKTRIQAAAGDRARVALLTPTGADGAVTQRVLASAGFDAYLCSDIAAATEAITGDIVAIVIAEEALNARARARLLEVLREQPQWSDLPVIVLAGQRGPGETLNAELEELTLRANVTVLERPVRIATLVTTLRAAERARRRQFELRRHLEERRQAEETLRESEARLRLAMLDAEEANRAKTEFLTTMSHELRTPLNAIGGYAQLLSLGIRGPLSDEQRQDLERIDKSQRHLLSLINDILNFAKLEAGRVDFEIEPVSISAILADLEPLVMPQLREKQLHYDDHRHECAAVVLADEEKVRQILLNLLSNAIKFTQPGGTIEIQVEGEREAASLAASDTVSLTVSDTGIGIAQEKLAAIFEPFVQLGRRLASTHEGTGLGLSISRNLARGMGGDLVAHSDAGRGARFTLELRRAPTSAVDVQASARDGERQSA